MTVLALFSVLLRVVGLLALIYVGIMMFAVNQVWFGVITIGATAALFLGTGFAIDKTPRRRNR